MSVPNANLTHLAMTLLSHFDLEVASLEQLVAALEEMRQALIESSLARMESARSRQAVLTEQLAALRATRAGHVEAAAAALRIPPGDFTVRALTARLPGTLARHLDAARERTRDLALRADALARRNAALTRHCLAYVRERLEDLSSEVVIGRYSANGKAVEPPRSSIIAVQG
jgi:hypothetical protein